ncbi:MAG TPA: pilus assembly protein TadG-related protein [Caulobacteraceae bacterium]|jgi:Flp pilus assembly protein TadG|nr:pilus assembly protein TadG-related protein [Caulobacteraceae bacterium]
MARRISNAIATLFTPGPGGRGGNVAILFAVLLPVVVGGAGMGVETTYWRYKQLQLQGAADAAAFAAGVEKRSGSADAKVFSAVTDAAQENGFNSVTAQVNSPPTSGAVTGPNAVEVILQADAQRFFTAYFTNQPVHMRARAVSTFTTASSACILALGPAASPGLLVSGSAVVAVQGCNVMANSIANDAVTVQGSARLTAPCIVSGGGTQLSGSVTLSDCAAPITQAPRAADPYRNLPAPPTTSPCKNGNGSNLQPGTYCSGLDIHNNVTMQPGVYVVSGGDFRLTGGASLTGSGVTIYLKGSARVDMNGNAEVQLTAPTTGPYAGILFFGDRTSSGGNGATFNGTANSHLTGAIYFPTQAVNYQGNFSGQSGCTQVVADTIVWTGNTSVAVDCTSQGMASIPVLGVVKLAE